MPGGDWWQTRHRRCEVRPSAGGWERLVHPVVVCPLVSKAKTAGLRVSARAQTIHHTCWVGLPLLLLRPQASSWPNGMAMRCSMRSVSWRPAVTLS